MVEAFGDLPLLSERGHLLLFFEHHELHLEQLDALVIGVDATALSELFDFKLKFFR